MSSKSRELMHDALPLTDEARDNQLYALARNLAEERLKNGQATGAEIVYLLRAGSEEEKLKKQLLEAQTQVAKAKAEAIRAEKETGELFAKAMAAFRDYSGEAYEEIEDENLY